MRRALRVLLVDDEPLLLDGMSAILRSATTLNLHEIDTARDGEEAVLRAIAKRPDVVIMDIRMPRMDGIEATRRITHELPQVRVLMLTTLSTEEHVAQALLAGAGGYLLKDRIADLVDAVESILDDEFPLSAAVAVHVVRTALAGATIAALRRRDATLAATYPRLTPRELEAVQNLAAGRSNDEIGRQMFVSTGSVKSYLGNAAAKLAVRGRVQLLIRATELGLVKPRM